MEKIASIHPAAPKVCPIEDLFAVMLILSINFRFSPYNFFIATASAISPTGVEVA